MNQQIPAHLKSQSEERGRLFKNRLLERLTRTPIEVPAIMHTLISAAFLYSAYAWAGLNLGSMALLFISGLLFWTLAEYIVHRWGYHTHTSLKWWINLQHLAHGIHHQYPRDPERLAMPPLPALLLISLFFGLFWLIGGKYSVAFFPGFLIPSREIVNFLSSSSESKDRFLWRTIRSQERSITKVRPCVPVPGEWVRHHLEWFLGTTLPKDSTKGWPPLARPLMYDSAHRP